MQIGNARKEQIKFLVRFCLGAVFFISGLNYSNTYFFRENPLFGVPYFAEIIISFAAGAFGYFLVPTYFFKVRHWVEDLIVKTTYKMVTDFWNEYTSRMEVARKQRERERKKREAQKNKEKLQSGILLDTSVLIDGRIIALTKLGFITPPLIVPKFVVNELHVLSDSKNDTKRKKGRRGLDVLNELKNNTKVVMFGSKVAKDGVDKELVKYAKDFKLKLMTLDFNLNKVAQISNIKVLNINDLVEALKPEFIPGDELNVKIIQKGKEKKQGVGYLADGTMIVVTNADALIGESIDVVVNKLIQSPAGKMVFCDVKNTLV